MSEGPGWAWVGLGMRAAHAQHWLEARLPCGVAEVHAENHFAPGGAWPQLLSRLAAQRPISLHAVGLGLGSAVGLDRQHLRQLARWVRAVQPIRVSDHACFGRAYLPGTGLRPPPLRHAADLLPLRRNRAVMDVLVSNIQQAQEALGQALLIENLSVALPPSELDLDEADFLNEVARRSGCGLLIDINNLFVNALNAQARWCSLAPTARAQARQLGVFDGADTGLPESQEAAALEALLDSVSASVRRHLQAVDAQRVGEVHLAGFTWPGPKGPGVLVDDHGSAPSEAVWRVWGDCMRAWGPRLTVVEWDTHLPAFHSLLELGQRAAQVLEALFGPENLASPAPLSAALVPPPVQAVRGDGDAASSHESHAVQPHAQWCVEAWHQSRLLARCQPRAQTPAQLAQSRNRAVQAGLLAHRAHAAAVALQVLQAAFPRTHDVLGPGRFARMARAFWRAFGPQQGDLNVWGGDLCEFIEGSPELQPWPHLADLARLEWAMVQAAAAPDAPAGMHPSSLYALGVQSPNEVALTPAPGATWVPSGWRLLESVPTPFEMESPHTGFWIWRRGLQVQALEVGAADGPWLQALAQGGSLADVMGAASAQPGALPFETWLPRAVQQGWVLGLQAASLTRDA